MAEKESKKLIVYGSDNFTFLEPKIKSDMAKKKVITEISNAWKNCITLDEKGWLWVEKEKLHSILRTNRANVNHILMRIEDKYKMISGNKTYIRGFQILALIAQQSEENATGTKSVYLDVSKQYYDAINSCDKVKLLRLEYDKVLSATRKTLKKKRKSRYKIKEDELTGEKLRYHSEFSHIRSVALYGQLADSIENGLIVNRETHALITAEGINNEEELKLLCEEKRWSLQWYDKYKQFLKQCELNI